ncbi:MAG: response regulator HsfA, partial [Nitrospirae bacterium]|nr:response regulator HsfA [Nitrospirota bacterium]
MRNILVLSDNAKEILSVFKSIKGKFDKKDLKQKTFTVGTDPVNPLQYDMAFLDLDMAEWQKRLLELRHRMPVIAYSGANVQQAVEAMKLGASDFLEKPLTSAVLAAIIQQHRKKILDTEYGFDETVGTSTV